MPNSLEQFNGRHKGQACIIIASGPSVYFCDLSLIHECVTISVNAGCIAISDSNYFVSDDEDVARWSYFSSLQQQTTIPLLYEDKLKNMAFMFKNKTTLFKHRTGYNLTDVYQENVYENRIWQARTSVGTAIHIAHIMGCSPIGLLGVDCCRIQGKRWFWQFMPEEQRPFRLDANREDRYCKKTIGKIQTDSDLIDISRYWKMIAKNISNHNCILYNLSEQSLLEAFPKMKLDKFIDNYGNRHKSV